MLDKLLSLLGLGGGRRPAPPPVVRANLLDTLLMLELQDPKFSEIFPKLLQFDPKVRDVFLYLAYLMCNILRRLGLGDEYGIYQYIVDRLLTPMGDLRRYEQFRRAVTRCEHFVNYPYYDIYVAFNTPLFSVAVAPLFREADRAVPILRVMNASKNMYIPFVFIMTARNITITPEVFNVQRYLAYTSHIRLPGPRLYYMIERCLKCEEVETGEVKCQCLVEDGECYDPSSLETEASREANLPNTEIIYVEKHVKEEKNYVSRRITVAFAYSLATLANDADIYASWGLTVM